MFTSLIVQIKPSTVTIVSLCHPPVYIPHSSDKTGHNMLISIEGIEFTSLIVQIKLTMIRQERILLKQFTSLIVQIKPIKYLLYQSKLSRLHPS